MMIWPEIIGPSVRVTEYALPIQKKLSGKLRALNGRNAAVMANHGAVCIGRDMEEAFVVAGAGKACRVFIEAEFLGGAKEISPGGRRWIMHKYYLMKYSKFKDKK